MASAARGNSGAPLREVADSPVVRSARDSNGDVESRPKSSLRFALAMKKAQVEGKMARRPIDLSELPHLSRSQGERSPHDRRRSLRVRDRSSPARSGPRRTRTLPANRRARRGTMTSCCARRTFSFNPRTSLRYVIYPLLVLRSSSELGCWNT